MTISVICSRHSFQSNFNKTGKPEKLKISRLNSQVLTFNEIFNFKIDINENKKIKSIIFE